MDLNNKFIVEHTYFFPCSRFCSVLSVMCVQSRETCAGLPKVCSSHTRENSFFECFHSNSSGRGACLLDLLA